MWNINNNVSENNCTNDQTSKYLDIVSNDTNVK